jgi:2-keto-myo-inositol isomerase
MFPFKTALNASTLFPFELDITKQVEIAAAAGYQGLEIWMKDLEAYMAVGGSLADLRQQFRDAGIAAVNTIAFAAWADADADIRKQGLVQAEREMQILAELGCPAIAAPPFGTVEASSLEAMAEHYASLATIGQRIGVEPILEFWGRAKRLSQLSEAVYVAMKSGLPNVRLLLDPFHMYIGGSDISGVGYLQGHAIGMVHVNDYPAQPARTVISDAERVFPGEGIAPSQQFARLLHSAGYTGYLSLELFLPEYGTASALTVAKRGLAAMHSAYSLDG